MRLTAETTGTFNPDNALVESFEIINRRGLHARASAKFVQLVDGFDAHVRVEKDGMTVGGTSIMGLMMLAASPGCCIKVSASGVQAREVMQALGSLIADKFGEEA
ncbi:phosphocarrier protein [Phyllobacterium sp. YR620]|uniref:HPr family phosphocarrier protein n=1 Tax=Phyllobacterium pellucidum TaxID=2740464 RepID=A0A849VS45_9HYPH|nr:MULTISPECIES: HPr family phosphocarrier protein [Phyllobacterium]MRG54695.1 HPr family phosphocarrier protein [Phyllobacterium sp. SYP-B3895]NTS32741.1 HPr family phosphocarrier protein [Phyllobacterium pellucidum]UGY10114.1 HPr family phosphocarrier protein [Phyllobacterium sp. T1018]SDP36423.1 phosphocarrier protein [Phyllobacterium sp. YR620]SFI73534.1 phosphocarrier protein [Phyllobacterium sp. CL33Tsu]